MSKLFFFFFGCVVLLCIFFRNNEKETTKRKNHKLKENKRNNHSAGWKQGIIIEIKQLGIIDDNKEKTAIAYKPAGLKIQHQI